MAFLLPPPLLPRHRSPFHYAAHSQSRASRYHVLASPRCCTPNPSSQSSQQPDSIRDGFELPVVHHFVLDAQCAWLETELRAWLDTEFRTKEAHAAHRVIAQQVIRLYRRLRAEGVHDLGTLVIEIGGGLEGVSEFYDTFVGPWNVANKTGEFLVANIAATAPKDQSYDFNSGKGEDIEDSNAVALPPNLSDTFERYRFLQQVLEGSVSRARINGSIAEVMGFTYDTDTGTWDGANVSDQHFSKFGNTPPDALGDVNMEEWTETLKHMEAMLGLDEDEDGKLADGLQTLMETLHGFELTKLQQSDTKDYPFEKRSVVAKWLHLIGNYC